MNRYSSSLYAPETLPELIIRIWRGRKIIAIAIVIGALISLLLIFGLRQKFEATMIVAPPTHDSRTDSFVEGVFVYAPDVEAQIPTGSPEFIRFEQSLRGASVAKLLFQMDGIIAKISEDTTLRGTSNKVKSPEDLALYLQRQIKIEPMGATPNRKIIYRHPDAAFAAKFLVLLRKADDQIIRRSVRAETETKIEWLKAEFVKSYNPDHRKALAQLLMSEERRRMLLSLETPYAVNVVEESSSMQRPSVPNRAFIFVMMMLVSVACGSIYILFRNGDHR